MAAVVIFVILSALTSVSVAEDRVHGIANEGPIAISPEAYAFFHPNTMLQPAAAANNPSLPLAASATVQSAPAHQSTAAAAGSSRGLGAGGVAGISLSFLFVCLVGMGVYYVMVKRRDNLQKSNPEQFPAKV